MAFEPKIKACVSEKCTKLILTDVTGAHSLTGDNSDWGGAGSPDGSSDSTATFTVDGGTATNITSYVPATVAANEFSLGEHAVTLADGWHTIVYTVTESGGGGASYTDTIKIFTYCNIKCCVFSKMLEMKTLDLCKDVEKVASYMHLWTLYKSMIYAANGCDADQATDILDRLNKLCPAATTGGCGCS